jgi:hypothetical protein
MFKHVVCRGIENILIIFNSANAAPGLEMRELMDEANNRAGPIWNDTTRTFAARRAECDNILRPVLAMNLLGGPGAFNPLPSSAVNTLDMLFRKHYERHRFLLIGQANENAYCVQDLYAREVATALGSIRDSYGSRVTSFLGKVYGRTSIPLLSMASVSAFWEICKSPYYKRQLSLVSSVHSYAGQGVDS